MWCATPIVDRLPVERAGLGGRQGTISDPQPPVNGSVALYPRMLYYRSMTKPRSPDYLDRRSQALKKLVAATLREHPERLAMGRENMDRWREEDGSWGRHTCYMLIWERAINEGVEACCQILEDTSEETQPLRQAAPFAGVVSEQARRKLLNEWERQP